MSAGQVWLRRPPLRKQLKYLAVNSDNPPLPVRHFTRQYARRMNKSIETIPMEVLSAFSEYRWPGNVCELQNVIERAVIISAGPTLEIDAGDLQLSKSSSAAKKPSGSESTDGLLDKVLRDTERQQIVNALKQSNCISGAQGGGTAGDEEVDPPSKNG